MSEQSDRDLCSWGPLARRLSARGYRVVLWDYQGAPAADELTAVVRAVRPTTGGEGLVLLGASKGAKASIVAAAGLGPAVVGVVSLSAEQTLQPRIDVATYVPRLSCPLLLLTAANDPYGSAAAATAFLAMAPKGTARAVALPGAAHGVDLLSGPTAAATLAAVDSFLAHVTWR
jgi:dienelactone hydrolase